VFKRISLEYTQRILSPSAIQFKVEKSDSIDFDKTTDFESMQQRIEIVFVVKLQTSQEISPRKNNFGELN